MAYYRLHSQKVTEEDFIANAKTWCWDFDDNGALYERAIEGCYSACTTPKDLLAYIDGHVADDEPIAVFDGIEEEWTPQTDCIGEVWVKPTSIIKWVTVKELKRIWQQRR